MYSDSHGYGSHPRNNDGAMTAIGVTILACNWHAVENSITKTESFVRGVKNNIFKNRLKHKNCNRYAERSPNMKGNEHHSSENGPFSI